jgi:hypothetical protein
MVRSGQDNARNLTAGTNCVTRVRTTLKRDVLVTAEEDPILGAALVAPPFLFNNAHCVFRPTYQAPQHRPPSKLHVAESLHAAGVCCSALILIMASLGWGGSRPKGIVWAQRPNA